MNKSDFKYNLRIFISDKHHNMVTYRNFYAEELFDEIKGDIEKCH